jgi:hypothetical protein
VDARATADDRLWVRHIGATAGLIAGAFGAWLCVLHLRMIFSPAPQEMREGALVWVTRLLLEGRNPYSLSELPASTEVYGILYHLVTLPFAAVFGNSFAIHRLVSGLSIFGASALLYGLLRRQAADAVPAFVGTVLFYMASLYFVGPVARPDGLGVLLSMIGVTVLFRDDVSPTRFALGLGVALLALLTKSYFAYPPFVLAAYQMLFGRRLRGLVAGAAATIAAGACILVVAAICPAYINVSFVANAQSASYDVAHLARQTKDWAIFSAPLLAGLAAIILRSAVTRDRIQRPNIFTFATLVNTGVFLGWLGGHPGAHMTYLLQLVTPMLTLAVVPRIGRRASDRAGFGLLAVAAFALNAHYYPLSLARFERAETVFARLGADLKGHHAVLGSTEVAGLLALFGRPVVDSGHAEYFGEAALDGSWPGVASAAAIRDRWDRFNRDITSQIASRNFDLIVRSRRHGLIPRRTVEQNYQRVGTLDLEFAWAGQRWPIDLWVPSQQPAP